MMQRIVFIIMIAVAALVTSCKKKADPVNTISEDERARNILFNLMEEWYFWYQEMPSVVLENYTNPYNLLEGMRYRPNDRWSFVADYDEFNAYYEGSFAGHGVRIGLDTENKARIAMIYKLSPLYPEGVRRGWIIKSINGTDIAALLAAGNYAAYDAVLGPRETGITNTFLFTKPDGTDIEIASTKSEFQVNSVLEYDTVRLTSGLTGYLAFEAFIEPSFNELEDAFAFFIDNDITDLILDLRYNSGGMLDVATELASYIAGNTRAGTVFISSLHNDKKSIENEQTFFKTTGYPLDITRLAVITTRETASASENIINGLMPHLEVKCFGDTTGGKPVGMYAFTESTRKFIFAPITFQLVNAVSYGDYFNGFPPEQYTPDDMTRDFGDPEELSLKAAIDYLESGVTKSSEAHSYRPARMDQGRPDWQKNLFIRTVESNR